MVKNGFIAGDLVVSEVTTINGVVSGSIQVLAGGGLHLNGTCFGNITVASGALANVHGAVGGDIRCAGIAALWGKVSGCVIVLGQGAFTQSKISVVHGGIRHL